MHGIRGEGSDTAISCADATPPGGNARKGNARRGRKASGEPRFRATTVAIDVCLYKREGKRVTTYFACVRNGSRQTWRSRSYRNLSHAKLELAKFRERQAREAPPPPPVALDPMPEPRRDGAWIAEPFYEVRARVAREILTHDDMRPESRAECISAQRPCPWMSCRFHLGLEMSPVGGLRYHDPERLDEMADTCALDVADRGAITLDEVGTLTGVTRERIRQVESYALYQIKSAPGRLGPYRYHLEDVMRTREGADDGEHS
jgi:hypothetical protein